MTPHRDAGVGTLVIDLRLGKLGRYRAASGTLDHGLFRDVLGTIRSLRAARRWDLLALLVNRHVHPLELHRAVIHQRLADLPSAEDLRSIRATADTWVARLDRAPTTRRQYAWLLSHFGAEGAKLGEVHALLQAARAQALADGKRVRFNGLRVAVRMMLRDVLGAEHALTRAAASVEPLKAEHRLGNPLTIPEARQLADRLAPYGPMWWALCLTGMRQSEYFGRRYELKPDRIAIHGTKTRAAERAVPKVYPIAPPTCSYDHFRDVLSARGEGHVRVHDARYTFTRWCDDAGIPTPRLSWYLGHAVVNVTGRYGLGRGFAEYLDADAQRLRDFLGDAPVKGLEIVR